MAWPGTLTVEEQTAVITFVETLFRQDVVSFVNSLALSRGIKLTWDSGLSAMFVKLAIGDVIPKNNGLAGSFSLTKAQVTSLLSDLAAILTTYDTQAQRDKYMPVVGAPNMIS